MLIELTGWTDTKLGKYDAIEIVGTRLDNKEEWTKAFFKANKDLVEKLEEFAPGDVINVKLERKGKFWNIVDFSRPSQELVDKVLNNKQEGNVDNKQQDNKKSTWGGRTGEAYNRSAAIYLAFDILKTTKTEAQLKKTKMNDLYTLADEIFNYINDGTWNGMLVENK